MADSAFLTRREGASLPASHPGWRSVMTAPRLLVAVVLAVVVVMALAGRIGWGDMVLIAAIALVTEAVAERVLPRTFEAATAADPELGLAPAVESFADILSEPCIVINDRSVTVYRNPAARTLFPRMRIGDPLAFTLRDPDIVDAIERARAAGRTETIVFHQTVPNETWFHIAIAPFGGRSDGVGLLVLTLYDLTEQRRTDQLRADFVANASHELRTPLTSLMGFIETLQGSAARDEAARTRFLGIMRNQAERMSGLIDDLLSLSRIEQRQHLRPTARIDLRSLLTEVVETLQLRAAEEGVEITAQLPESEIVVIGERQELIEVFENLLENAIKYGSVGKTVELVVEPATAGAHKAHKVSVIDHGPGIAEEHVPRLTERFYRVESESGKKKKGTGLGLAIVKHIVSRHHGALAIRSRLGEGTRVEVQLPSA